MGDFSYEIGAYIVKYVLKASLGCSIGILTEPIISHVYTIDS